MAYEGIITQVSERFLQFFVGIHDDRAVPRGRLVEQRTAEGSARPLRARGA